MTTPNADAIGLFVNASSVSIPTGTDRVRTTGYSQAGLGAANYLADSTVNSTYVSSYPRAAFLDANGRGFRLSEPVWDFEMFGAIPDDTTDCYGAWTAMKAYAIATKISGNRVGFDNSNFAPAPVRFNGRYYSSQTWQVHLTWSFFSEHAGAGVTSGDHVARIRFANDQTGLVINNSRSNGDQVASSDIYDPAIGTSLRGICVIGGGTDRTKHGIWARTKISIEDCAVDGFPGNGVNMVAYATNMTPGTNTTFGNCNSSIIDGLAISNIGRHGFYTDGDDVNACSFTAINVISAGCAGIYDSSYLGNTYTACAVHGCGTANLGWVTYGGYSYSLISEAPDAGKSTTPGTNDGVWFRGGPSLAYPAWSNTTDYIPSGAMLALNPNNRSLFLNPYIEGGCPFAHAGVPAIVVAPNLSESWSGLTPYIYCNNGISGALTSPLGFSSLTPLSGSSLGAYHCATLGGGREEGVLLKGEAPSVSTFRMFQTTNGVGISWNNLAISDRMGWHGPQTTATFGRSAPQPYAIQVTKFVLDDRHMGMISAVSDLNGTDVAQGEVYFNRGATAGGKVGWVVTTGGTVGSTAVLKPFGAIDA